MSDRIIKVFIVEDDLMFGRILQKGLEKEEVYDVTLYQSGQAFINDLNLNPDIVTLDYYLPDMNGIEILKKIKNFNSDIATIVISGQEKAEVVVEAYTNGANHYIIKNENAVVELINSVKNISKNINLRREVEDLRDDIIDRSKYDTLIGESKTILKVLKLIQKVENNNILVLITGESGTGKDVVASTIHYNSPRKRRPFIAVNVAAIPEDLIESELFGHEKGAFTGAVGRRIGKFEEANGGTIFLDEIGEMDIGLQSKLLRILQDNKVSKLGSNKEIKLDIRVIAATNQNLYQRVKEGKFREDLFYRLQGFLIHLPPLRERDNDIILLAKSFLAEFCKQNRMQQKSFSKSALEALVNHDWPGNVRELRSMIERAVLISDDDTIESQDLIFSTT